jgi:hypothetical protein
VARVATLQAVVHSILYIVMYIQGKIQIPLHISTLTLALTSKYTLEGLIKSLCFVGHLGMFAFSSCAC